MLFDVSRKGFHAKSQMETYFGCGVSGQSYLIEQYGVPMWSEEVYVRDAICLTRLRELVHLWWDFGKIKLFKIFLSGVCLEKAFPWNVYLKREYHTCISIWL